MRRNKGFTLIELLVVIAIIGILASVVLASLNSARQKARDSKRIGDLKQIQLALELYADSANALYPATIYTAISTYLASTPYDPVGTDVKYSYCTSADFKTYHLGATLEDGGNPVLKSDADAAAAVATSGGDCPGGAGFDGTDGGGTTSKVYDLTP